MTRKKYLEKLIIIGISAILLLTSCASFSEKGEQQIQQANQSLNNATLKVQNQTTYTTTPIQKGLNGEIWIPLQEAAESLDFRYQWDPNSGNITMGYSDIIYQLKIGSTTAFAVDQDVDLPNPPQLMNDNPYISTNSLTKLWGTSVRWNPEKSTVYITPIDDTNLGGEYANGEVRIQSQLKRVDEDSLVRYAYRFRGVPYKFGAAPFEQSRRFDCSSFTRHVFKNFGVYLPRTARAQAKKGHQISLNKLQPGDMLFFYVPGRFKSNRIVGHNGIYVGNGKFIHTYGKPGVTIDSIRVGYWRKVFLFAKRMVD